MEEYYYEESNPKHVIFKCTILLFLIGLAIGCFIYYKNQNVIRLKTIQVELGDKLSNNVNDYLKTGKKYSSEYKLNLKNVDVTIVGNYTYKVKYNKHTKTGTIKVVDTIAPIVTVDDSVIVGLNENIDPNILVTKCEDLALPCSTIIADSELKKLSSIGDKILNVDVSDASGNKVRKKIKVTVSSTETVSNLKSSDLNYYINSENDDTIEHVFFEKLDKAVAEESKEYEILIDDVAQTDFNEYTDQNIYGTKLITVYNKYGYVIGIQVLVTFYDGTKKLLEK